MLEMAKLAEMSAEMLTTDPRSHRYSGADRRSNKSLDVRRMAYMLDALDYGMLLVGEQGLVQHVNHAARCELRADHPLHLADQVLSTRIPQDGPRLRSALAAASERGLRDLLCLGAGRSQVAVAVVPLPAFSTLPPPLVRRPVLLLLGKRQGSDESNVDAYASNHGLTSAETVVIKGLCNDLSPAEIAARQGVGLSTVRSQIGAIRYKTGNNSIQAVMRQVALLPPLVNALQAYVPPTNPDLHGEKNHHTTQTKDSGTERDQPLG